MRTWHGNRSSKRSITHLCLGSGECCVLLLHYGHEGVLAAKAGLRLGLVRRSARCASVAWPLVIVAAFGREIVVLVVNCVRRAREQWARGARRTHRGFPSQLRLQAVGAKAARRVSWVITKFLRENYYDLNMIKSKIKIKIGLTLIGINVICEVPFYFVCICQKCYIINV